MIKAWIIGSEKVISKFEKYNDKIDRVIKKSLVALALDMTTLIKGGKLSGQVLNVQSGTLRRSIDHRLIDFGGGNLMAEVYTNVPYAAKHEYGFLGTEDVRSFMRRAPMPGASKKAKKNAPKEIRVQPFRRRVNVPEKSFMRSALEDMRPNIIAELNDAIESILK
jgi:phage gpG-like protein